MSDENNTQPSQPAAGDSVAGERHVSEVAGRSGLVSKKAGIGVIVAGAAIMCAVVLLTSSRPSLKTDDDAPKLTLRPQVTYVPPPAPVVDPKPVAPALPSEKPPLPTNPVEAAPANHTHTPKLLVYSSGTANSSKARGAGSGLMSPGAVNVGGGAGISDLPGGVEQDPLASQLKATRLTGVSASVLRHQPFLLTKGTSIPCVLQTAMDSTLPGLATCVIPQDVLGKSGLTLLDRGTKVVGEFKGGVRQGVERMFVLWTRAETPQGVVINLDSPGTDPLGRAGFDGEVDSHFWKRFGAALLLSTVDGVIQAGVNAAASNGNTTINTGTSESVIAQTLQGSINIPPTIRKNQGELVNIMVARDLDFSTVYGVRPSPRLYVGEARAK